MHEAESGRVGGGFRVRMPKATRGNARHSVSVSFPRAAARVRPLDLGAGKRVEDEAEDVGDVGRVELEARVARKFFPVRVGGELRPGGFKRGEIREAEHVSEAGETGADEGVGVEDAGCAGFGEDGELAVIEHINLIYMIAVGGRNVSAEMVDAFLFCLRGFGNDEPGMAGEGTEEGALDGSVGRRVGVGVPERLGGFHELGVFGELEFGGDEGFEMPGGHEEIVGGLVGAEVDREGADGRDAEAVEGWDEGVCEVVASELRAGAVDELVAAEFVEFGGGGGLRGGRGGTGERQGGRGESGGEEISAVHSDFVE